MLLCPQTVKKSFLILLLSVSIPFYCFAANRYWVASSAGTWNNPANWSASSGGTGGASVPGASDRAIFNSGGVGACTISTNISVSGIAINTGYTQTITQNTGVTITVGVGSYTQESGTFIGGDADFTVNSGLFTLTGGEFTGTSGILSIGGSRTTNATLFSTTGGTFTHNNGTVSINPDFFNCSRMIATLSVSSPVTFYNLLVDVDDQICGEDVLSVSGTVVVTNNFIHNDGFVNDGTIEVRGDIYLQGSADGGTGTILLNGTGDQYYHNSVVARFAHVRVDKPTGVVLPGAGTVDFYVQRFTLEQGEFRAPTGTFFVGGNWGVNINLFLVTGGIFTHNNGTVSIDPDFSNCSTTTGRLIAPAPVTITFYNLLVDVDDQGCGEDVLSVSGTVVVANNFIHNDGFVNNGTIEVRGDIYLQGSADGGTGTILLNGTGDQYYHNSVVARFAHVRVDKPTGVVLSGAGTVDLYVQRFTLEQGEFRAPTGTFFVGGTWSTNATLFSTTGGTFTHNNGTVSIDPDFSNCNTMTATLSASSPVTFYNLLVDVDDQGCGEDVLSVSGSVTVLHDFILRDGFLNLNAVSVRGNVFVEAGFDGGSTQLIFTGGNAQDFILTGATDKFNGNVTINKSANNVTLQSACVLDAPSQILTLTNGLLISTSTNLLTLGDNVTASGGSAGAYVSGPIRKVGNDAFVFPVGKAGIYSPIGISAPVSVTDAFDAEYQLNNIYDTSLREPTIVDISTCDYWTLERTTGSSSVQVTLTWNHAAGCYGTTPPTTLTVARWSGAIWEDEGNSGTTVAGTHGTVTSNMVGSFSPFAVASTTWALPIELMSFTAQAVNHSVVLNWETASERSNDFFTVERSSDASVFEPIHRVEGKGTTLEPTSYTLQDNQPLAGRSYYRLKQTDLDGAFTYSHVVSILYGEKETFTVYPNPVKQNTTLYFSQTANAVVLYDMYMRVVRKQQHQSEMDLTGLLSGVYFIQNDKGSLFRVIIY